MQVFKIWKRKEEMRPARYWSRKNTQFKTKQFMIKLRKNSSRGALVCKRSRDLGTTIIRRDLTARRRAKMNLRTPLAEDCI